MLKENALSTKSFVTRVSMVTAITLLIVLSGASVQATKQQSGRRRQTGDLISKAIHAKWFRLSIAAMGAAMDRSKWTR